MTVHYYCRHCQTGMGTIEESGLHASELGIHKLTEEERQEMVTYQNNGDIHIRAICEDCHEALSRNPDLHQYDHLIH